MDVDHGEAVYACPYPACPQQHRLLVFFRRGYDFFDVPVKVLDSLLKTP
tara:strand:- start:208 stop:354 length:147 start_codon:yes stop_codon:yes gene_type:complete